MSARDVFDLLLVLGFCAVYALTIVAGLMLEGRCRAECSTCDREAGR